jgi:hypothetical protein
MPTAKKKSNKKRAAAKAGDRRRAERNFNAALWSVPASVEWSGLCHQRLLDLIHAGEIEAVRVGPEQSHVRRDGTTRSRSCVKFLVVAKSLIAFIEGLGGGKLQRSA